MVDVIFWGPPILFSIVVGSIYIPTNHEEWRILRRLETISSIYFSFWMILTSDRNYTNKMPLFRNFNWFTQVYIHLTWINYSKMIFNSHTCTQGKILKHTKGQIIKHLLTPCSLVTNASFWKTPLFSPFLMYSFTVA